MATQFLIMLFTLFYFLRDASVAWKGSMRTPNASAQASSTSVGDANSK